MKYVVNLKVSLEVQFLNMMHTFQNSKFIIKRSKYINNYLK